MVCGDGVSDIVIGAILEDNADEINVGAAYVIFGIDTTANPTFPASFDLNSLDGTNGFRIGGELGFLGLGGNINNQSDINGDGFQDIVLSAENRANIPDPFPSATLAESTGVSEPSKIYLIAGRAGPYSDTVDLNLFDASIGATINVIGGLAVGGGSDVSGDGIDDFLFSGADIDVDTSLIISHSYVVFGTDF